ncbi:MAG: MaoC family dehydratase N-terminal domain-containing protein [Proteobacteria bacterium]|nr:MaoC family dehydratase N-terminal domain-containing protein [Pseudomonadota bacterium]
MAEEKNNYITADVKAMIGVETDVISSCDLVSESEIRRFFQAVMDPAPRYWDEDWARNSRYEGVVAPPAFPVHAFRRAPTMPDPLDNMEDPDFDGWDPPPGLPPVPIPFVRMLNGGYDYTFYRYAKAGERLCLKSKYKDIYQRDGRSGPLIFVLVESKYFTDANIRLLDVVSTSIFR